MSYYLCYNFPKLILGRIKMKNELLYVLLENYADYEPAYIASNVNCDRFGLRRNPPYENKVVAPSMECVKSCGGFRTLPDYSFNTMPDEYAALILVGGYSWQTPEAERLIPIVRNAISKNKIVGAICNAASFMASHGFLNDVKHTGNGLDELKRWGGSYTNEAQYQNVQVVSDKNIVTANGTAALEFAVELTKLLKTDTTENIDAYYNFMHIGLCDFMKNLQNML